MNECLKCSDFYFIYLTFRRTHLGANGFDAAVSTRPSGKSLEIITRSLPGCSLFLCHQNGSGFRTNSAVSWLWCCNVSENLRWTESERFCWPEHTGAGFCELRQNCTMKAWEVLGRVCKLKNEVLKARVENVPLFFRYHTAFSFTSHSDSRGSRPLFSCWSTRCTNIPSQLSGELFWSVHFKAGMFSPAP